MSLPAEPRKVPLRIRLPYTTEAEFIERYAVNVARGGIFIATRATKPEGTEVSFELVLADGTRLMRGEGVVQKVIADEQPGKSGMLVRFTRIDARTKVLIDRLHALREGTKAEAAPVARPSAPEPLPAALPQPLEQAPARLADDVVLGIDFGTTTCRAALFVDDAVRLIALPQERSVAMPSVVAFDAARQKVLVGSAARRHGLDFPDQAAVGFKRLMGRRARSRQVKEYTPRSAVKVVSDPEGNAGIALGGRAFSVPELAGLLLAELKSAAQEALGRHVTRAVLCVPAWYNDYQRGAVLDAARHAGLTVLRILNEPSAAALAFGHGRGLARKRVLVYDLGGGTFDASVVEITGDDIEVVSTGGDAFLGGLDFDQRLADLLIADLPEGPRGRVLGSSIALQRIREAAESAKIALSAQDKASVHVPFATTDDAGGPMDLRADLSRAMLERSTADLVERTVAVTRAVLEAAGLTPQALDEVLVVGGQSRAPAVRRSVEALLGKLARSDVDAQGAVAMGAALLGHALVQAERGKRGVSLSEVLSAPVGIAVRGGGMRRVLERNTRLPAEKTLTFPMKAGESTRIAVFQGSAPKSEDNEYLGALCVTGDRTGDLELRFQVTNDGRMALTATLPGGKAAEALFSTLEASEELQAQLLAEAPLPGDEPGHSGQKGLLLGLKRMFGR